MTLAEQTNNLQQFGYSYREASFLVTAALHSGYFLARQFAPQAGKTADQLSRKLLTNQHATAQQFAHNTFLYHLKSKPFFRAIGQENNRHRRGHDPFHVRSKVMGLDYVLAHPGFRFLPTEQEKMDFFSGERGIPASLLPGKTYAGEGGQTRRFFVDKYPIRVDPDTGQVAFCYIDDAAFSGLGFATWLAQYDTLLRKTEVAEVVFVSTNRASFASAQKQFEQQLRLLWGVNPAELLAYFELRKNLEAAQFRGGSVAVLDTFKKMRRTFSDTRFEQKYAAWLTGAESLQADRRMEFSTYHLSHSYRFFRVKTGSGSQRGE